MAAKTGITRTKDVETVIHQNDEAHAAAEEEPDVRGT